MKIDYKTKISIKFANGNSMAFLGQGYIASGDKKVPCIIDNILIYNRLLIAKRGNIGIIHIIVCEDSDMFI